MNVQLVLFSVEQYVTVHLVIFCVLKSSFFSGFRFLRVCVE